VRFARDGSGAVAAMTVDDGGQLRTARRISDRAPTPAEQNAEQKAAMRDLPLTAEEMARYEGTYTLQLGPQTLDIRVFAQDGQLMSQATGQSAFRLRAQGDHVFIPTFSDEVRLVFTVENGRAAGHHPAPGRPRGHGLAQAVDEPVRRSTSFFLAPNKIRRHPRWGAGRSIEPGWSLTRCAALHTRPEPRRC
jgi:hypothetical protein